MNKDQIIALAKQIAAQYGLDPTIVCAVIEQESAWDTYAIRFEPGFLAKYMSGQTFASLSATEKYARCFSWGLMQIMGEVAREQGFNGQFLSELCLELNGITEGCKHLTTLYARVPEGTADRDSIVLLHWNGGGNTAYPAQVLARTKNYA